MNKLAKKIDFTEVYDTYYPLVLTTLENRVRGIHDARDLAQEIFISLFKNLDSIENVRKWLFGAMRNQLNTYYKKQKDDVNIDDVLNSAGLTFVNGFRDTRVVLQKAIDNPDNYKNEKDRALFELVAIKNFNYREAAEQLGITRRQATYNYEMTVNRILDDLARHGIKNLEDIL